MDLAIRLSSLVACSLSFYHFPYASYPSVFLLCPCLFSHPYRPFEFSFENVGCSTFTNLQLILAIKSLSEQQFRYGGQPVKNAASFYLKPFNLALPPTTIEVQKNVSNILAGWSQL
jgi:hypothetical protein